MNLFKKLKDISGKLVMGIPQLAAIGGASMMLIYGAYQTDSTFASKQPPIRSLSGITNSSSYAGLQRKDGLLTSINIKDSLNQVATPEERAALEGNSGSANNFGLDNVANIQNVSFGSAAETSATDGLGMGANKAVLNGPLGSASTPAANVPGVNTGAVSAAAGGNASGAAPAQRASLAPASMARASGNAFNAAAGAIGGSSSGAFGTRTSGASGTSSGGSSSGEGYKLSGAMPSGSNAVSAMGLSRSGSGFMAGGRNSTNSRATRSFREKNDLKDISKRSADAAANRNRAANEGSRAFLASSRNSGGMSVEGGVDVGTTGSADFENAANQKLNAIGNWQQEEDDFAEEQDKARNRLMWMMIALVAVTIAAITAGYHLISKGKMLAKVPVTAAAGAAMVAWGWVVLGVAMAYAATVLGFGIHYQSHYNGNFMPVMSYLLSLGAITALAWAGKSAMKVGVAGDKVAQGAFMKKAVGAVKGLGMMAVTKGGSTLLQKGMESDASASQSKK